MTSNRDPHITLIQPSELLASLPHLLGFHPADSLVVVGLHGSPRTTISVVLRSDLPPPSGVRALAEYLLLPLTQHGCTAAVMIVVGGIEEPPDDDLPQRELLARCESVLVDGGFPVVHQLWTPDTSGGRRWHCYDEFDCTGITPDPTTSELAVAAAEAGLVTYDRREDIVATLQPEPDEILARRTASLDRLTDEPEPDTAEPDDATRARVRVVQSAIDAAGAATPTLSDNDVIELSRALADHRVRDTYLDFDELPDIAAAERLWTALARATPAPERAEPACLLAFSAYARGDGVLAGIALAEAEAADPGHRLAGLLRSALTLGLPPKKIRIAGIRAATFARTALTDNQPPTPTTAPATTTTATPTPAEPSAPATADATSIPVDVVQTASAQEAGTTAEAVSMPTGATRNAPATAELPAVEAIPAATPTGTAAASSTAAASPPPDAAPPEMPAAQGPTAATQTGMVAAPPVPADTPAVTSAPISPVITPAVPPASASAPTAEVTAPAVTPAAEPTVPGAMPNNERSTSPTTESRPS